MSLVSVEHLVRDLYDHLGDPIRTQEIFQDIISLVPEKFTRFDENRINEIPILLNIIYFLLNIEVDTLFIQNPDMCGSCGNEMRQTSLNQYFMEIRNINIQNDDNLDGYKSPYHEESLFCHLIMAMLVAFTATNADDEEVDKIAIMFTAFIHDIGKPNCKEITRKGYWAFPAHGEIGSLILIKLDTFFIPYFGPAKWNSICRAVCIHMCGYHEKDFTNQITKTKWSFLSLESESVKRLLIPLSIADQYGRFPKVNDDEEFEESYPKFVEHVMENDSEVVHDYDCVAIFTQGQSASGKTSISNEIIEKYPSTQHFSRDFYTVQQVCKLKNWAMPEIITGEFYAQCYTVYRETKGMAQKVNQQLILDANPILKSGGIVIIDTLMTMFDNKTTTDFLKGLFEGTNPLIISIIVGRNTILTDHDADRHGSSLIDQIQFFGPVSAWHPLGENISRHRMTSRMTKKPEQWLFGQPHIVFTTSWSTSSSDFTMGEVKKWTDLVINFRKEYLNQPSKDSVEWLNKKFKEFGEDLVSTTKYFETLGIILAERDSTKDMKLFMFSYRDGACHLYGPEIPRHVIVAFDNSNKIFSFIRDLMPRGPEAVSSLHKNKGIDETESYKGGDLSRFPPDLQNILNAYENPDLQTSMIGNLSMKVDGSIVCFQYIIDKKVRFNYEIIMSKKGGIFRSLVQWCKKLPFLLVISTSGTSFISTMIEHFVHSFSEAVLNISVSDNSSPEDFFNTTEFKDGFMSKVTTLYDQFPTEIKTKKRAINATFEAVVPKKRNELAVLYEKALFKLHSLTIISEDGLSSDYYNHSFFPFKQDVFSEPTCWKEITLRTSLEMLDDLSNVIHAKLSEDQFWEKYPPTSGIDRILDYEGFVVHVYINGHWIYLKLKTLVYYWCHKLRADNIPMILALPSSSARHFPLKASIDYFFTQIKPRLIRVSSAIIDYFDPRETNELIGKLTEKQLTGFNKDIPRKSKIMMLFSVSKNAQIEEIFIQNGFLFQPTTTENTVLGRIVENMIQPWRSIDEIEQSINSLVLSKDIFDETERKKVNRTHPLNLFYDLFEILQ